LRISFAAKISSFEASSGDLLDARLIWDVEENLNLPVTAYWAAQAFPQEIEGHRFPARPNQGRHVQLGHGVAADAIAVAALVVRADQEASDADAPAELPGFSEGLDWHGSREQNMNYESSGVR
jgi:hypothetical protein